MIDVIHFYRVDNLEKVKNFYGNILGLPLYKDQGTCLIYCAHNHGKIGFCTHHPVQKNADSCITFVYSKPAQVDEMYTHLSKTVETIDSPSVNTQFNIYHFFCKDDQGIQLEFQCFLHPDGS